MKRSELLDSGAPIDSVRRGGNNFNKHDFRLDLNPSKEILSPRRLANGPCYARELTGTRRVLHRSVPRPADLMLDDKNRGRIGFLLADFLAAGAQRAIVPSVSVRMYVDVHENPGASFWTLLSGRRSSNIAAAAIV